MTTGLSLLAMLLLLYLMGIGGFLLFAAAIMITVGVHEYGHYLMMVRNGVRVIGFQINVGKTLKAWTLKNGTVFSICLVPIGGLARPVEDGPDGIESASRWVRFKIYVAGMVANCLVAMLILIVMWYGFGVIPRWPEIPVISEALAGIRHGLPEPMRVLMAAFEGSFGLWIGTPAILWNLFVTSVAPVSDTVVGPVGIAHISTQVVESAASPAELWAKVLMFIWLINVAVAQMNLLPIPALDGGRIAMLPFEGIMSKKVRNALIAGSMFFLLALILGYATYNDIVRWISAATTQ